MRRLVPLLMVLGCGPDDGEPLGPILSPADGATITAPVIPLIVTIPNADGGAPFRVHLDGRDVTDPTQVQRRVYGFMGGERHVIGALDLTEVEPGDHELVVQVGRWPRRRELVSSFTLAPAAATLHVSVLDESGALTPGRVYVFDADGELVELASPGTAVDHKGRDVDQNAIFCADGTGMAWVPPGEYTLVGWRGLRGDVDVQQVTVLPGDNDLSFTVPLVVDTPGEVASDLHVHTGQSIDAWVPDRLRFESLETVGLDIYVITEHNHVVDAPSRSTAVLPDPTAQAVTGSEVDIRLKRANDDGHAAAGHLNVFPLKANAQSAMPEYRRDTVAEIIARHRALEGRQSLEEAGDRLILQLNHARGIHFHPDLDPEPVWQLFDYRGFDRALPPGEGDNEWMLRSFDGVTGIDFDVLEVVNRFSVPLYQELRGDWFHLLDEGYYRTASGNSDTHGLTIELAGMTVTMVEADRHPDGRIDLASWVDSLDRGRATVSTGAFVSIDVQGAGPGDTVQPTGPTSVAVRVQAPSWVPLFEVRLIERSEEIWRATLTESDRDADGRLDKTFAVDWTPGGEDSWLVAEAGYPVGLIPEADTLGMYAKIAPGYVPLGFTNAVRVDVDGNGWNPSPRLGPLLPPAKRPPTIPERLR